VSHEKTDAPEQEGSPGPMSVDVKRVFQTTGATTTDFGLRNADCGLKALLFLNPQSTIRIPQLNHSPQPANDGLVAV
jgi:hypothetical protein